MAHREEAGNNRGLKIEDYEISDTQVKRVVNKIVSLVKNGAILDSEDGVYYSASEGKRMYIAYTASGYAAKVVNDDDVIPHTQS